jgi:hypothetical protein
MSFLLTLVSSAVFTGTGKAEQIKMWDVRARAPVYELATGNNRVESLLWDSERSCLYAATECLWMDRMGYRHDYRTAKIPKSGYDKSQVNSDEEERCWPENAWHKEDYFGHTFDAGEHRICT